jgi:SAM-dependent methyltransferase
VTVVPLRRGVSPILEPDRGALLWQRFLAEVARRQLAAWLPDEPSTILDLSRRAGALLSDMVAAGHRVVHVADAEPAADIEPHDGARRRVNPSAAGRLSCVRADGRSLDWVAPESVDAVVVEGGALSEALAAELTLEDLHRVLRPGGRVLLCVDSLVAGLSQLADQGRWAELADVPAADVVLVPGEGGTVSRCFWPEELHGMLTGAGFDVEWVRPRTVLSEETVTRALLHDAGRLGSLVTTELALEQRRQGESVGARLVASARRL